jgi:predicted lipid-binding transport protein (Tim44 family)
VKLSWTRLKISIAGARLTHLVQKDKIWDHGSMIEQAKTIFFKLKRVKGVGNIEDARKYLSADCFHKLKKELDDLEKNKKKWVIKNLLIREAAVIAVSENKNNKPDCFTVLFKVVGIQFITGKDEIPGLANYSVHVKDFSEQWSFVRHGEWWLLDSVRSPHSIF